VNEPRVAAFSDLQPILDVVTHLRSPRDPSDAGAASEAGCPIQLQHNSLSLPRSRGPAMP